jgi:hypothetical protein
MFCNTAGRTKIDLKNGDEIKNSFNQPASIFILVKAYPTIPLSGRSNLVLRYLSGKVKKGTIPVQLTYGIGREIPRFYSMSTQLYQLNILHPACNVSLTFMSSVIT